MEGKIYPKIKLSKIKTSYKAVSAISPLRESTSIEVEEYENSSYAIKDEYLIITEYSKIEGSFQVIPYYMKTINKIKIYTNNTI